MRALDRLRAKSALFAALGLPSMGPKPVAEQALDDAAGDLHGAFARRLGIPTRPAAPTDLDAPKLVPNRRERRDALRRGNPAEWRATVLASHSRTVFSLAEPDVEYVEAGK